jgi:LCP family protein required for cell wall assembly
MMGKVFDSPIKSGALLGAAVVLLVVLISGAASFLEWWNTPLGQELAAVTGTPGKKTPLPPPAETLIRGTQERAAPDAPYGGRETAEAVPTAENTPAATSGSICGGPETFYLLVAGVDSGNYIYGLADAIRIIRVDFVKGRVVVLPLPRDLYVSISVSIPALEKNHVNGKLNQAYFYGSPGMGYYDHPDGGPGLLARTLGQNYNLPVDRYLSVNTRIFRRMVDEVGGVDVYLPENVYGHYFQEPVLYLEAGSHHLDGKQAEMVARHRTLIGDFGRMKNQTILFKAFIRSLLTPEGLKAVPDLVEIYRESVLMDLTPNEISKLICLVSRIDREEDIQFVSFPRQLLKEERVYDQVQQGEMYVLIPDHDELVGLLADFQAGRWP